MDKSIKFYLAIWALNAFMLLLLSSSGLAIIINGPIGILGLIFIQIAFAVNFHKSLKNDQLLYLQNVKTFLWLSVFMIVFLPAIPYGFQILISGYILTFPSFQQAAFYCLFWFILFIPFLTSIVIFSVRNKNFRGFINFLPAFIIIFGFIMGLDKGLQVYAKNKPYNNFVGSTYSQTHNFMVPKPVAIQDPTLSIYKNNDLNYQVFYPSNWQYSEGQFDISSKAQVVGFSLAQGNNAEIVGIVSTLNTNNYTLDDYINSIDFGNTVQSKTKIIINGNQAIQITFNDGTMNTYFMRNFDSMIFDVRLFSQNPGDKSLYEQMVNKFNF